MDFFNIEGKQLDNEQIESVIYTGNQLVIAGAGAGKTLSIVGKVKYLIEKEHVDPKEILVLAFTDKVVNELKERIGNVVTENVDILTFHKLGLKIFNRSKNFREIDVNAFYLFLREYLYGGKYEEDPKLSSTIYNFVHGDYFSNEIINKDKIRRFTNNINKLTFNGEKANSVVALIVCNMLYVNNIEYEYVVENQYSHYINVKDHIIHFTKTVYSSNDLSLKNEDYKFVTSKVYNFLRSVNIYISGWRKYSEYLDNPLEVKRFEELFESLNEAQRIADAIDIYEDDFDDLIEKYCKNEIDIIMFLEILKNIRRKFCEYLSEKYQTDFNYMITGPIDILKKDKILDYKYIIVDEYQDISPARYNLLVELLNQNNGYLMAYGDDWQSIYSFSGSNNKFFMDFSKKLTNAKEIYLKNTYRNSKELIGVSSDFVMLNPCQKSKNIKSNKTLNKPIFELKYTVSNVDSLLYTLSYINLLKINKDIHLMVLGRTNYAINMIKNIPEIEFAYEDENNREFYTYQGYENIKIQFLTIHRAKGLEADFVFLTSANEKDMPLEMNNRRRFINILSKMNEYEEEKEHEVYEGLPNSEERRLFYVALTRTKNNIFISTPNLENLKGTIFLEDLHKQNNDKINIVNVPQLYKFYNVETCQSCGGLICSVSKKGRTYKFCENKCKQ